MARLWNRYRRTSALPFSLCLLPALVFGVVVHLWPSGHYVASPRSKTWFEELYEAGLKRMGLRSEATFTVLTKLPEVENAPQADGAQAAGHVPHAVPAPRPEAPPSTPLPSANQAQVAALGAMLSDLLEMAERGQNARVEALCRALLPTEEQLQSVLIPEFDAPVRGMLVDYLDRLRQSSGITLGELFPLQNGECSPVAEAATVASLAALFPEWNVAGVLRADARLAIVRMTLPQDAALLAMPTVFAVFFWEAPQWYYLNLERLPWSVLSIQSK